MLGVSVEIPELSDLVNEQAQDVMRLATFGTANRMKIVVQEPKSGRIYKRGKKFHTASAPGQAPATDSGNLVSSIMPAMADDLTGEIMLNDYGVYLEFGTNRIAARPFIIPSLDEVLADLNL